MTIDELCKLAPMLEGSLVDAINEGKRHGINHHDVKCLRHILGFSSETNLHRLTDEQRNQLVKEYNEGGTSILKLARKYKIRYNSAYCILKSHKVDTENPRLWSRIKEMRLEECVKKGMSMQSICQLFGKAKSTIERKIERLRKDKDIIEAIESGMDIESLCKKFKVCKRGMAAKITRFKKDGKIK